MIDRWEIVYSYGKEKLRCPTCDFYFAIEDMCGMTVEEFRHCPNCGERLHLPEEKK